MKRLIARLQRRRLKSAEPDPILLSRRRIYILPTRAGVLFSLVITVMLLGSINYNNNLGLWFTFLMISTAFVTMLHTHRNLSGLIVRRGQAAPVFAGDIAHFELLLNAPKPPHRTAIALQARGQAPIVNALTALPNANVFATVKLSATQRGVLTLGRCEVFTEYPLGLFRAWSWIHPDIRCIVYPAPERGPVPAVPLLDADASSTRQGQAGREDFHDLRTYRAGDSSRHLAWKHSAFGPTPYTKQFEGDAGGEAWLDWDQLPDLAPDARLARLCRWVLDSHRAGYRYGLRLPGNTIALDRGEHHKRRCLEALALLRLPGLTGGTPP